MQGGLVGREGSSCGREHARASRRRRDHRPPAITPVPTLEKDDLLVAREDNLWTMGHLPLATLVRVRQPEDEVPPRVKAEHGCRGTKGLCPPVPSPGSCRQVPMKPFTPEEQQCGTLQPGCSPHTAWIPQGGGQGLGVAWEAPPQWPGSWAAGPVPGGLGSGPGAGVCSLRPAPPHE